MIKLFIRNTLCHNIQNRLLKFLLTATKRLWLNVVPKENPKRDEEDQKKGLRIQVMKMGGLCLQIPERDGYWQYSLWGNLKIIRSKLVAWKKFFPYTKTVTRWFMIWAASLWKPLSRNLLWINWNILSLISGMVKNIQKIG